MHGFLDTASTSENQTRILWTDVNITTARLTNAIPQAGMLLCYLLAYK